MPDHMFQPEPLSLRALDIRRSKPIIYIRPDVVEAAGICARVFNLTLTLGLIAVRVLTRKAI